MSDPRDINDVAQSHGTPLPPWKRVLDFTCCLAALPVFALCTLGAALVLRTLSPSVLFFRQERVGHLGRRFSLYKFRTMHFGADTVSHQAHLSELIKNNAPMQKLDARGDARLIRGAWLARATGLDELPQIINILRGEMSVVGPRPCIPYEYENYTDAQRKRTSAVPGLTGLWQVSGKNRTTFEEMVSLDVKYAQTRSLWLDLKIIVRTVPALAVQVAETRRGRRPAHATPAANFAPGTAQLSPVNGGVVLHAWAESTNALEQPTRTGEFAGQIG